jgi:hypothetical protein
LTDASWRNATWRSYGKEPEEAYTVEIFGVRIPHVFAALLQRNPPYSPHTRGESFADPKKSLPERRKNLHVVKSEEYNTSNAS